MLNYSNNLMKKILIIMSLFFSSPTFAQNVIGHYSAYTESEVDIDLKIEKHSIVKMIFKIIAVEEDEETFIDELSGKWKVKGNKLFIQFSNGQKLTYEIKHCLSYSEFGSVGCSFGLKPIKKSVKEDLLNEYGLWKVENLEKLFKADNAVNKS